MAITATLVGIGANNLGRTLSLDDVNLTFFDRQTYRPVQELNQKLSITPSFKIVAPFPGFPDFVTASAVVLNKGGTGDVIANIEGNFPAPLTPAQAQDINSNAYRTWVNAAEDRKVTSLALTTTGPNGYRLDIDFGTNGPTYEQLIETFTEAKFAALRPTLNGERITPPGLDFVGTAGANTKAGTARDDKMDGRGGNDTLDGKDGDDRILGGKGADKLVGGKGIDVLFGGDGNDRLSGGPGGDTLAGGGGRDTINGGDGADIISGGAASDRVFGDTGNDSLNGNGGNDRIFGGRGDDTATGEAGNDRVFGGGGNDILDGGGTGNDTITGGDGDDTLYAGPRFGSDAFDAGGSDTLYGGAGNDFLNGGRNADIMFGGSGDDTMQGSYGNDTLDGGTGDDFLFGWHGQDVFVFNAATSFGQDTVRFNEDSSDAAQDRIEIDNFLEPPGGGFASTQAKIEAAEAAGASLTLIAAPNNLTQDAWIFQFGGAQKQITVLSFDIDTVEEAWSVIDFV